MVAYKKIQNTSGRFTKWEYSRIIVNGVAWVTPKVTPSSHPFSVVHYHKKFQHPWFTEIRLTIQYLRGKSESVHYSSISPSCSDSQNNCNFLQNFSLSRLYILKKNILKIYSFSSRAPCMLKAFIYKKVIFILLLADKKTKKTRENRTSIKKYTK